MLHSDIVAAGLLVVATVSIGTTLLVLRHKRRKKERELHLSHRSKMLLDASKPTWT